MKYNSLIIIYLPIYFAKLSVSQATI